jgi:predicted DNA-binding transcriptional regulator AlpA
MTEARTYSVQEVAAATGFTRQAIYRAIKDGRLNRWLIRDSKGRARLTPEAPQAIRSGGVLALRVDTAPPGSAVSLDHVSGWGNALLLLDQWTAPPWDGPQWRTLAVVAAQAEELAATYGRFNPEVMAQLEQEGEL